MSQHVASEPEIGAAGGVRRAHSPLSVLRARDFRLLWIGQAISLLGDQFYLIALPWLMLRLTGDPLALGLVLALEGIPRALFMLAGGALTDRFSPRAIMLGSNLLRLVVVTALAALVLTVLIQAWMLYAFGLLFGLIDAFFYPASNAIVPRLIEADRLEAGNAMIVSAEQLTQLVGPALAGGLIALLSAGQGSAGAPELWGIGVAFAIDALSFAVSALTLWLMRVRAPHGPDGAHEPSILDSIRVGVATVWRDTTMRTFFILAAAINFLIMGPFAIGVPVLASTRFPEGAAAFGIITSALGAGALLGTALAGLLPRPAPRRFGPLLLIVISTLGIGLALLGLSHTTLAAALLALAMGAANSYVVILFITWLQNRTPEAMMGRVMSLLMFAAFGTIPVSSALAGALAGAHLTAMFVADGGLMTALVLLSALSPTVRAMGLAPPLAEEGDDAR